MEAGAELSMQLLTMIDEEWGDNEDYWKICYKRWITRDQNPRKWHEVTHDPQHHDILVKFFKQHRLLSPEQTSELNSPSGLSVQTYEAALTKLENVWETEHRIDPNLEADARRAVQLATTSFTGGVSEKGQARLLRILRSHISEPEKLKVVLETIDRLGIYLDELLDRIDSRTQPSLKPMLIDMLHSTGLAQAAKLSPRETHTDPEILFQEDIRRAYDAFIHRRYDEVGAILSGYIGQFEKLKRMASELGLASLASTQHNRVELHTLLSLADLADGDYKRIVEHDMQWLRSHVDQLRPGVPREISDDLADDILEVLSKYVQDPSLRAALLDRLEHHPETRQFFVPILCDMVTKHGAFYHFAKALGVDGVKAVLDEVERQRLRVEINEPGELEYALA
ncbi:MAG: hypothetical protein R3C68_19900 [Myxococcota bacterium]